MSAAKSGAGGIVGAILISCKSVKNWLNYIHITVFHHVGGIKKYTEAAAHCPSPAALFDYLFHTNP
jgi:hypothetical protein